MACLSGFTVAQNWLYNFHLDIAMGLTPSRKLSYSTLAKVSTGDVKKDHTSGCLLVHSSGHKIEHNRNSHNRMSQCVVDCVCATLQLSSYSFGAFEHFVQIFFRKCQNYNVHICTQKPCSCDWCCCKTRIQNETMTSLATKVQFSFLLLRNTSAAIIEAV